MVARVRDPDSSGPRELRTYVDAGVAPARRVLAAWHPLQVSAGACRGLPGALCRDDRLVTMSFVVDYGFPTQISAIASLNLDTPPRSYGE